MSTCHDTSSWGSTKTIDAVRFERITVGVDGSPNSLAALKLAVGLAARDNARVEAIYVYRPYLPSQHPFSGPLPSYGPVGEGSSDTYDMTSGVIDAETDAQTTLESAVFTVFGHTRQDNLVLRPIEGTPHHVLATMSATADLLIVGAQGHSGRRGLLLGSTAQACTRHATCAVLVVPAQHTAEAEHTGEANHTMAADPAA